MRSLVDAVRQRFSGGADASKRRESRAARMAIDRVRRAHTSSSAIFYSTLPAFAYSLLGRDRAQYEALGTPAERWPQIQAEIHSAIRALERAEAALDKVSEADTKILIPTWSHVHRYLIMKRKALAALADVPLPPDSWKCGQDLLELCRVVDIWSQQRMDAIDELRAGGREAAIEGYGDRWGSRRFWARLRQRLSARAWVQH
jgi:hypothetical protein